MSKETKNKLIYLLVFGGIYLLMNYLLFLFIPVGVESLIPEEARGSLPEGLVEILVTMTLYAVLSFFVIFYKLKLKIEIERPFKELRYFWLLPLLIPCFASLIGVALLPGSQFVMENPLLFSLDLVLDLFVAVSEDFIFVDVMISFLSDFLPKGKYKNLLAMLIASVIFTLSRNYLFIDNSVDVTFFLLAVSFVSTFTCGYLAIYFDSALIPVGFHYLFNVLNFIVAPALFVYPVNWRYYLFVMIFVLFMAIYVLALYRISRLMKYRHSVVGETGLSFDDNQANYEE
ncbi:MAG: hypothetical protein K5762_03510 [Bacilli bacterium]|nr:hypothetical protein [Bacilli bacterium]